MSGCTSIQIETFWDHSPTEEELSDLLFGHWTREEYMHSVRSQDSEYGMIFRLFMMRGDARKAKSYLAKIQDQTMRNEFEFSDILSPDSASL